MTSSAPDLAKTKVVVDSNVWISAIVFGGAPRRVFETIVQEGLRLVVSAEILTEIRRVVVAKFPDFIDDVEALFGTLRDQVETVPLGSITVQVCRDPDDNRVLETAILSGAAAIISGDKDLLTLDSYEGVAISRPQVWLERWPAKGSANTER